MPRRPSGPALRRQLVEELEAAGNLTDPAVRRAFLAVPRERFLPGRPLEEVYADKAVVTRTEASGAPTSSSSQPAIMAIMLERLELAPGLRVLEIGAGTGYNAALLSRLGASVTSVELQADVAAAAARALESGGHPVTVVTGDGRDGWPSGAPYDRIVLTASTGDVCKAWFDQLAPGGLLQLPLHLRGPDLQAVVTLRKDGGGLRSTAVVDGGFMVLRDPGARTPAYRGSGISVADHVEGRHRSMGSLGGDDLRRLTAGSRRRLAALMLTEPRTRRAATRKGAALWLQLARPRGGVVARYFRSGLAQHFGVAVAATDGRSLAVAVGRRTESYGDATADEILTRLLAEWRERGRPTTADLDVRVTYRDGAPHVKIGWSQSSTVRARR
jgi:protein-L-isoaspartate(D-aspartate) O-methyltransferase